MTNIAHASLTGSDLHEPKGISGATSGQVYIANGSGSGAWTDTGATIGTANFTTGDLKPTIKTSADTGWVMLDDGSIGDLSSSATTLASAGTSALFSLLWNNVSDTYCTVSGGRGVSAAADFAANKRITLPKTLGRVLGAAGAGSGLTSRALGINLGEENHSISTTEVPSHTHTASGTTGTESVVHTHANTTFANTNGNNFNTGGGGAQVLLGSSTVANTTLTTTTSNQSAFHTHTIALTTDATGGGAAHNTMQPSLFVNWMIKL